MRYRIEWYQVKSWHLVEETSSKELKNERVKQLLEDGLRVRVVQTNEIQRRSNAEYRRN